MMNVYLLLDRSGSMESQWDEALGSINGYVKALPAETNIFLATFDYDYDVVRNTTARAWEPITRNEIYPRGGTRLFDSAARIMQRAFEDNAERTMVVVMTDGEENSSLHYKQADVKSMASKFDAKKWELVFLGANFDKVGDVATQHFGRSSNKFYNMTSGNMAKSMTSTLATASTAYATRGASINFTDEDKEIARGGK